MLKCLLFVLSSFLFLNCSALQYPPRTPDNKPFFKQRTIYVDYTLALHAYNQKDYEQSLELCLELLKHKELHPEIVRLLIRNRISLEQWDKIDRELDLLGDSYEDRYLKGKYFYTIGKYQSAQPLLESLTPYLDRPNALEVYRMLIDIYKEKKEWNAFSQTALSILQVISGRKEPFFRATLFTLLEQQQPQAAMDFFLQSLYQVPLEEDSLLFYVLLMIRFFEEEEMPQLSEEFLEAVVDQNPAVLELYLEYFSRISENEERELATEKFLYYLEEYPDKVIPAYIRFLVSRESTDELLDLVENYYSYVQENENLLKMIGIYFFNRKKPEQASHFLELAQKIAEPDSYIYMLLLSIRLEKGDLSPEEDSALAFRIIELEPEDINGYVLLNRLYQSIPASSRPNIREKFFQELQETEHYYRFGTALLLADSLYSEALDFIQKGTEVYPERENLLIEKGFVYYKLENLEQAEEIYKNLIEQETSDPFVYNNLAYLWAEMNKNLSEALKYAYISLEMAPEEPSILDTIGWIYFLKENYAQAEKYLEQAGIRILQYLEEGFYTAYDAEEILLHLIQLYEKTEDRINLERWQKIYREITDSE